MKKNLLTLITFALVVVNLVLTAIIAITIVPEVQKVNNLVTTVSNAIDLDLQAAVDADSSESISLADITPYEIPDTLTINLKTGSDG
ncbi:MAG: flagellar basal body-associated protein FliL, partial [Lachnospiraceae bacterium]|nr:flagellar basal body-associated protein FliL [Lachnospiraceae bacterium]